MQKYKTKEGKLIIAEGLPDADHNVTEIVGAPMVRYVTEKNEDIVAQLKEEGSPEDSTNYIVHRYYYIFTSPGTKEEVISKDKPENAENLKIVEKVGVPQYVYTDKSGQE